jgi:hydrogenase nickel incorporation protein HypA/HybF
LHELSVAQSLLDIALRHAKQADATRITDLHLLIGDLASIVDDSLQFHWDMISQGTLAEGAQLHFQRIPTELRCDECGHTYQPGRGELVCPSCAGVRVRVVRGEEFQLESIEVER